MMTAFTPSIDRDISEVGSRLHLDDPLSGDRVLSRTSRGALPRALCRSARNPRVTKQRCQDHERGSYSISEENGCVIHLSLLVRTLSLAQQHRGAALLRNNLLRLSWFSCATAPGSTAAIPQADPGSRW